MIKTDQLNQEERIVFKRINEYFKSPAMTAQEKIINALVIAQLELDDHHFCNEKERLKIIHFQKTLDSLLGKIVNQS